MVSYCFEIRDSRHDQFCSSTETVHRMWDDGPYRDPEVCFYDCRIDLHFARLLELPDWNQIVGPSIMIDISNPTEERSP
jgi:hypothetical protein